ncbi:hypothetical protein FIU83_06305 [Halomonas sp. THAF5a]|uniref:hypothetical protein n=1 Tax=Halomonas sp. THAF5a TaxID=2587844 RepID=UPI001267B3CD|nr:hypothetical protein [Halomonas sp. THAF5a]QFU01247.1 hypothetical protein FIU83_06305 [Halomonas sp. THAF5a]
MIAALLDPFRTMAQLMVGLLPLHASEAATGVAVMVGLLLVVALFILPACLLGAWLEHRERRSS